MMPTSDVVAAELLGGLAQVDATVPSARVKLADVGGVTGGMQPLSAPSAAMARTEVASRR